MCTHSHHIYSFVHTIYVFYCFLEVSAHTDTYGFVQVGFLFTVLCASFSQLTTRLLSYTVVLARQGHKRTYGKETKTKTKKKMKERKKIDRQIFHHAKDMWNVFLRAKPKRFIELCEYRKKEEENKYTDPVYPPTVLGWWCYTAGCHYVISYTLAKDKCRVGMVMMCV